MGSAGTTSVQLQVFAEEQSARRRDEQLPPRRTLWMWATMGALAGSLGPPQWMRTPERGTDALRAPVDCAREDGHKDENDLTHDDFANRWRAPKQLELHCRPAGNWGFAAPAPTLKKGEDQSGAKHCIVGLFMWHHRDRPRAIKGSPARYHRTERRPGPLHPALRRLRRRHRGAWGADASA